MTEIIGNPKYKKVYLSGPITGKPNDNIEEFEKYKQKFKNLNYEVVNPHDLFTREFVDDLNRKLENKDITFEEYHGTFMRTDIKAMMDCDFIAVLNGYENSKEANIEVYIARNINMPIIDAVTLKEIFK